MTITVKTPEDIIGIIPHTLGYTPERSLVAIVSGPDPDTGQPVVLTTMRIDFDRDVAAAFVRDSGQWYASLITDAVPAAGVLLAAFDDDYCDADPAAARGRDQHVHRGYVRAAIDQAAMALARRGVETLGAWWVSNGRFGRIDSPDDPGSDLERAAASASATEMIASGSSPQPTAADLVVQPASAEARAEFGIDEEPAVSDMEEAFAVLSIVYPELTERRKAGETGVADAGGYMSPVLVRALDVILGQKWARDALEMILSFDHPGFRPADLQLAPIPELYSRALRFGIDPAAATLLVGLNPKAPRPRDVRIGIEFMKLYLPWGAESVRANAYGVIAWFEWALGGSTQAELNARAALEIDRGHRMATLILRAVSNGLLPQWLQSVENQRARVDSQSRE